jgi:transposase
VVTDGRGNVLGVKLTRGNRNECPMFEPLLSTAGWLERLPVKLAADKGYSSDKIRRSIGERGIEPVIPCRKNEHVNDPPAFDAAAYKRRNVIERAVGKLKEFRRIATRYEKLASAFLAMVTMALIVLYLRAYSSDSA